MSNDSWYELIQRTFAQKSNRLSIKRLCSLTGIARSGYYRWINSRKKRDLREQKDQEDFRLILEAYQYRGYQKGVRSIHMRLLHIGIRMNIKKIRRLMHKYGLFCPIRKANPYRRMANAIRTNAVADNRVNREFRKHGARKILLTDITYIPYQTEQKQRRFCYLSVIKDAYTEQVLSYVLSDSLEVDFVLQTVLQLIENHGTSLEAEAMIHSDQGCHYTSIQFRELINNLGLRQSMSRRGNCWDNAPQESFFGHMKDELASRMDSWFHFNSVKSDIDDWMDYYNNDRYQWNLGKLSPNEFYEHITTEKQYQ